MNWSGISNQSILGKILRLLLRLLPAQMPMPILQGKLKGQKWIVGSSSHGCWLGSYEFDKQRIFERTIAQGSTVFDLGGHVGFYTLLSSALVGATGKVFVFEPLPRNLFYLNKHLHLNNIKNVTVIEAAVLDKVGTATFEESSMRSMGYLSSNGKLQVRTVSLEDLIESGELPVPDYLKIDIEGAEFLALSGAKSILKSSHPTIFLATHGDIIHQKCCHLLQSLGYQIQPIDGLSLEQSHEILATYKKESASG